MIEKIERVVNKIIMPKYPELTDVKVSDLFEGSEFPHFLGTRYVVEFITSECLDSSIMVEIDSEIKSLFTMMSAGDKSPKISCFFDCEDGEGYIFNAPYGYNH